LLAKPAEIDFSAHLGRRGEGWKYGAARQQPEIRAPLAEVPVVTDSFAQIGEIALKLPFAAEDRSGGRKRLEWNGIERLSKADRPQEASDVPVIPPARHRASQRYKRNVQFPGALVGLPNLRIPFPSRINSDMQAFALDPDFQEIRSEMPVSHDELQSLRELRQIGEKDFGFLILLIATIDPRD